MAMGMLIASAAAFPEVQIELTSARENMTLRRRDADVAVRIADDVPRWLVGRKLADLQPLTAPIAALETPLWLITHPELRNTARTQVLMRAFAPAIANAVHDARAHAEST